MLFLTFLYCIIYVDWLHVHCIYLLRVLYARAHCILGCLIRAEYNLTRAFPNFLMLCYIQYWRWETFSIPTVSHKFPWNTMCHTWCPTGVCGTRWELKRFPTSNTVCWLIACTLHIFIKCTVCKSSFHSWVPHTCWIQLTPAFLLLIT